MAYIGFNPSQLAIAPFATKYFTGDGSTTTFTLDQSVPGANEANVEVFVENVQQNPIDAYTIGGSLNNQLIFSEAPVSGAAVYVIHKGEATYNLQPSTGSVTAATLDPVLRNFTVDKFTGTGAQTAFTLSDTPYSPNSILVTVDGIVQQAGTNYTVSGTTLTFAAEAPDLGSDITVVHLGFSSGNKAVMDASITPVKLSTGGPTWDTSSNMVVTGRLGLGGTYGAYKLGVGGNAYIGPASATRATGRAELTNNSVLTLKPHTTDSTNMNFGTIGSGDVMGIQVTNGGGTADWSIALNPFGGNVSINGETRTPSYKLEVCAKNGSGSLSTLALISDRGSSSSTNHGGLYFVDKNLNLKTTILGGGTGTDNTANYIAFNAVMPAGNESTLAYFRNSGVIDLPYGQIKFPATQNASSDANTLDDYEEGTWTPRLYKNGVEVTSLTAAFGRYVKIGQTVWIHLYVYKSSGTASGGVWTIENLPITATNTNYQIIPCGYTAINTTYLTGTLRWQVSNSSAQLILYKDGGSVATDWTSGFIEFGATGIYQANS